MNAVLRREKDSAEGAGMPENEKDSLSERVAELRSDVRHLQSDITDIKTDLRTTNQKVEETNRKIDALKDSLTSARFWAYGLYVAQFGLLLYVMARGFKWI